jgi:hypothetical protein
MNLVRYTFALVLSFCICDAWACDLKPRNAPTDARCAREWMNENLRVNDLLSVGTHNSYKMAIPDDEMAALKVRRPRAGVTLDYSHRPLNEELDDGARQLELDIYYDPEGGRFADPLGPRAIGKRIDPGHAAELSRPGFKVMHVADFDFRSTCLTFVACLRIIKTWSDAHSDHIPILMLINAKDDNPIAPEGVKVLKFDAAAFDAFDAEIASVFAKKDLITPDRVQGKYPTLREAVLAGNWPKLKDARGKILITLDEPPQKVALYRGARHSLEGRLAFINTDENSPAAAYLTLNEPKSDEQRIRAAVQAGFLVRTRADADTMEARSGNTERRELAFTTGAQYISTDYMRPDPRFGAYSVHLPDGVVAVCNPVRMEKRCSGQSVPERSK